MVLKCLSIEAPDPTFLTLDSRYWAGFLDAEALRRHAAQAEYDLPEQFVTRQLAAHDECFAIRAGDVLAAYGWYSTSTNHFSDELTLHFAPQWAYMYRGFTHPAYRGQRLHAIGMTMALAAFRARGFKGLLSCVEARNDASLKSCYRMGYRWFGTIYGVRLGRLLGLRHPKGRLLRLPLVYCTPGCKAFGVWLERSATSAPSSGAPQPLKA